MKRRILTLLIFLLLGAIVNVAVAWGCAAWINNPIEWRQGAVVGPTQTDRACDPGHVGNWSGGCHVLYRFLQPGVHRLESSWSSQSVCGGFSTAQMPDLVPSWAPWLTLSAESIHTTSGVRAAHACGWPRPTLYYRVDWPFVSTSALGAPRFSCGWPLSARNGSWSPGFTDRSLPLAPIWPGFAINTLFYAAILWLLFAAPFSVRRWRRIKRGLCPACAYPVGANDLCTECGKPVRPRNVKLASR